MAETLTYDPGTDSVTVGDNLTSDEQESLKVGEAMEAEQNTLLAGKYENAEQLEKAYVELQKKLGDEGAQDSETTGDTEDTDGQETSEEKEEAKEDSAVTSLMNEATTEFYDNNNTLSDETIEKFSEMSSTDLVRTYLELQKNADQPTKQEVEDLSEADVNQVRNHVGGEAEYNRIVGWASENLPKSDVDSFDELVSTGNIGAIKLAITGMKVEYQNANGYEGNLLSGKAPKTSADLFRSQAAVVEAMSDPRYDNDPAYRAEIMEKLERSDIQF